MVRLPLQTQVRGIRGALILCGFLALGAAPAAAHAHLQSSVPPVDGTVSAPPTEVVATFTEALEPTLSRLIVRDAGGRTVSVGDAHLVAGSGGKRLAVPVQGLRPGSFVAEWTAVSVDTHRTTGTFKFTVKP
jgi:methionine-rich copper-binding protein CopC